MMRNRIRARCIGCMVVTLTSVILHRLDSVSGELQHAQPMRMFIPHWMATDKFSVGMLHWKSDSPQGKSYSQDAEDVTAEARYFHNLHNGTFLELGALDGTVFSNTRFFEEQRGWRGVLIEPNREEFEQIPSTRKDAIAVHAAICDQTQNVHFISKRTYQQAPGSAGAFGGIWEFMAEKYRLNWYGTADVMPEGAAVVPCVALGSILRTFGISHIDFLSLDVEGAELQVLNTLDLRSVHVNVMVIEQDGSNPSKEEEIRQKLKAQNFDFDESMKGTGAAARNDWFVNKPFRRSERPA